MLGRMEIDDRMNIIKIIDSIRQIDRHVPSFQKSVDIWVRDCNRNPQIPMINMLFGFFCVDGWEEY